MSFIGDVLNTSKGAGFQANAEAGGEQVKAPFTGAQLGDIYGRNIESQNQQRQFLDLLSAQGGIRNQAEVIQRQRELGNQLQAQAMGQGPNPAQSMLAQQTGANTANQAALMAGQRGAGSNAGLLARQAAMQGAANQQNQVGQAATLQAQQQLAAQQALMQNQAQMGGLASQQVGQQQNALQNLGQQTAAQQQLATGAMGNYGQTMAGIQGNLNSANAQIAAQNAKSQGSATSGIMGALGTAAMMAHGGMAGYADGGQVNPYAEGNAYNSPNAPSSFAGKMLAASTPKNGQAPTEEQQYGQFGAGMANLVSKGASSLSSMFAPSEFAAPAVGGLAELAPALMIASKGGKVPGHAPLQGDHESNDNVPAMLSPGEIVIPKSIMEGKNAPEAAKRFVAAIMARHGMK